MPQLGPRPAALSYSGPVSYTHLDVYKRQTKARGFYLDDQFQVSGTSNANFEPDLEEGYVEWKAYDEIFSGSAETESQNFSSLEELSQEILSLLGEYYLSLIHILHCPYRNIRQKFRR